ncbi:hypothetical protein FRC03_005552 [Tulasnella sp. 419]|nr:hypothetical protein FRC03_005552 [Tulasnella sp. 419]
MEMKLPMRVGTCSVTSVVSEARPGADIKAVPVLGSDRWKISTLTDASFLTGGVERDWGFEDIQIHEGKVVNDRGVPGTENESEGPVGLQIDNIPGARM